ncbi:hypothetical protein IFO70_03595 [Phormidium tenue FACHB-886]|nr:hypothetical protein [Phormidium tenue FACHB-886]
MVTVVIGINLLIAVFCLYAAWQVWKLQKILARAADALTVAERSTYAVLAGAPAAIASGQAGTNNLRQQYRRLELQLLKAQKILALTGLSRFVWQWYTRRSLSRTRPKARPARRNRR